MRWFVVFIFIGCANSSKILPPSTGKNSELIFVIDDVLWEKKVDSLVNKIFRLPIEGINQTEPLFSVIQINRSEFKSILKTHKNIVIISKEVTKQTRKNIWAKGQFVAQFNWGSNLNLLSKDLIELRKTFVAREVKSIQQSLGRFSQKDIEKTLLNNLGIKCIIPEEYQVIICDSNLFWAIYDPVNSDEIKNLLVFSFIPKQTNLQSEVLAHTDSIFSKYLKGANKDSFARIEPEYSPYYFQNIYRGLWRLEKGFMGGPFLLKTHFIENKIVVSAGLIFAPQSTKRKYIKELEAIL